MKQVMQDLAKGGAYLLDAPAPVVKPAAVSIAPVVSLVSAGTERMLMEFGKGSLLAKARQQPDKVRQVLKKVRTDGLLATLEAVRSKLNQPIPLGYSSVGRVLEVGAEVTEFGAGDRVVSNGSHAEVVVVGRNLCAKIPDEVSDETASFTVLASIGLQGIRLAEPQIGETVAVIGVGLIGLLAVQMLRANGCRVLAVDTNSERLRLAESFGAVACNPVTGGDPVGAGIALSGHRQGVDAVLITASTKSNEVVSQAARMSRKRGRIVLVGVVGLELDRSEFYEKELSFQVSCSYGPGRYDPAYEEAGRDYPIGFVRWTEQRNFEAVLELMRTRAIVVDELISHKFPIDRIEEAYSALADDPETLGIVLEYPAPVEERLRTRIPIIAPASASPARGVVGCIGAGNFAGRSMIPALVAAKAQLHTIVSRSGVSAAIAARRTGFQFASTELNDVLLNDEIDTVLVLTQHSSHAGLAARALDAGKHVFVEKPLALTSEELQLVEKAAQSHPDRLLMVGFNRRFAPLITKMKKALAQTSDPSTLIYTINAGALPPSHWTLRSAEGGRILGEACHFVDLARFLIGAPIVGVHATGLQAVPNTHPSGDTASICLTFADGSIATVHYFANGPASFPKERIEVFNGGRALRLENFMSLVSYGWRGVRSQKLWRQDKGHKACVAAFMGAVRAGAASPIALEELVEVHEWTLQASRQLASCRS